MHWRRCRSVPIAGHWVGSALLFYFDFCEVEDVRGGTYGGWSTPKFVLR